MKRLVFLVSMIALLAGCAKIEEIDQPIEDQPQTEVETPDTELPEVIYASVTDEEEDPNTRTYVDNDGKTVLWHSGDAISYFTSNQHGKYVFKREDGAKKAEFSIESSTESTNITGSYGVYPYSADNQIVDGKITVTYPSTQTYAANSFGKGANVMVYASEDSNDNELVFRNACGYLVIKLYGESTNVKSVKLTALNGVAKLAGPAAISLNSEGIPEVTMLDDKYPKVTLDCSNGGNGVALESTKETATEFWFALPPGTIEGGIKITVTDTDNNVFVKETKKDISIPRNQIQPMAALEFEDNRTGDYQLIYTRPEGETTPYDFGESSDYENLKYFDQFITNHYYDSKSKRFVIQFEEPLTQINEYGFSYKDSDVGRDLTSIIFPNAIERIGEKAFNGCKRLKRIIFPGSLNVIDLYAFAGCTDLKTLKFLPSPTNQDLIIHTKNNGGFKDSILDTLHLNRELVRMNEGETFAPALCINGIFSKNTCGSEYMGEHFQTFSEIVLGDQVKTIHNYMFHYAVIKSITIPGSVTSIGNHAFDRCYRIESITFEEGPEPLTIGLNLFDTDNTGPFHYCKSLKKVVLNRELKLSDDYKSGLDSVDEGIFSDIKSLTDITLGPNVKTIHDYMFSNLPITSLNIPNTVTSIGNYAFQGCTALTSLSIPSSVTSIGSDAFQGCTALTSLSIPSSVTSIGSDAFHACEALESLIFESGTTDLKIGPSTESSTNYGPFYDSENLTTLNLNRNLVPTYTISYDRHGLFAEIASLQNVTLGNNVKTIGNRMFLGTGITGITIPSSVTTIENDAFRNCTALKSITIPGSVTSIGSDAFHGCTALTSLTFEAGTADLRIGPSTESSTNYGPFYDSKKLKTLNLNRNLIPNYDIKYDRHGLFSEIASLTSITLGDNVKTIHNRMFLKAGITSITIPGSVDKIDLYAFYNCTSLESITFNASPNNTQLKIVQGFTAGGADLAPFYYSPLKRIDLDRQMHYIDDEGNDFTPDTWDEGIFAYDYWNDNSLTTQVSLGDNVTYISKYMFSCVRMTGCWIPENVTKIDDWAFYYCKQLKSLSLGSTTPPALGENVFKDCTKGLFKDIYVPYNYRNEYSDHADWKKVIDYYGLYVGWWKGSESL